MAKTWYPVIDYLICEECGICVANCSHDVYDKTKAPSPIVTNPEGCIDHCHGCGNRCPEGAIVYVGEDTDWTPPNSRPEKEESCCSVGTLEHSDKKLLVEYLYLDLQTCDRCIGTDKVLDEVLLVLNPALSLAGYEVVYNKILMETAEIAIKHRFLSSPTIRINGHDICQAVSESNCGCCSEISNTDVDCRVFEFNGENYEVPPKEMLAEDILKAVFLQAAKENPFIEYELPDNLKQFFQGKYKKHCSSECDCN